jgi:hypothetical protein
MVISLGVFFSAFQAPHEVEGDSPMPVMDRFNLYRNAAGAALVWGKYSQPNQWTLQAMMLYVESLFLRARHSHTNCYLLCSVLIRIMLKMGLHRDPSKLPNISPYDGEMRKRLWHLAIQIDLLVSFHLGLPAMIHGIESDTELPCNLADSDFSEESKELPRARPSTDYTSLSYPINKAKVCRIFGLVARQAHSLEVPAYSEVMKLDALLKETYDKVPAFLKIKSMEESITDEPMQVIQTYGLAALYQKIRCVLHRKYLTDAVPKPEHDYSRRACLSAAIELLKCQATTYEACKPGGILSPNGWFVSALAVNDFLLADIVVALIIQSAHYWEAGGSSKWLTEDAALPSKEELVRLLGRSAAIWEQMAIHVPDCRKASDLVGTVMRKIEAQLGFVSSTVSGGEGSTEGNEEPTMMGRLTIHADAGGIAEPALGDNNLFEPSPFAFVKYPAPGQMHGNRANAASDDASWMMFDSSEYDWVST